MNEKNEEFIQKLTELGLYKPKYVQEKEVEDFLSGFKVKNLNTDKKAS